jgi:hypothetical protein
MAENRRFRWPADYYSGATPEPVLPRAAAYGCGAASLLVLLVVFAGGVWLARGGIVQLLDFAIGMSAGDLRGMYAKDVTPATKAAVDAELERVRNDVRAGQLPAQSLQPLLQSMQKATADGKVDSAEAEQFVATLRATHAHAKRR